jgi:hypothetical protein
MKSIFRVLLLAACSVLSGFAALAEPTHIVVRAQAQDAKFIGDETGGAEITLTDVKTGKILARGLTIGGTGDTALVMKTPQQRGAQISSAAAAGFEATLDIDKPTLIRAEAYGPMGKPGAAVSASATQWILPGHDLTGDGWILTLRGLVIEPKTKVDDAGNLQIHAEVRMMCGCPITPGGIWDVSNYSVTAQLLKGTKEIATAPLAYAGSASQFAGSLSGQRPGQYRLRIVASDAKNSNTGVIELPVRLR